MESGALNTAASAPFSASRSATDCRFSLASAPAKDTGCGAIGPSGAGGWSSQIASMGLSSHVTRLAPASRQGAASRSRWLAP